MTSSPSTTPPAAASATVWLSYKQLLLTDPNASKEHPSSVPNGLVAAGIDTGVILAGVHTGVVGVTVQLAESEPPPSPQGWEETEEVTVTSTTGNLLVRGMMASPSSDLPNLAYRGAGHYRLRVQAKGRSHGQDTTEEPLEHFLLTVWPLDEAPTGQEDAVRRLTGTTTVTTGHPTKGHVLEGLVPTPSLLIGQVRVREGHIVICNPYQQPDRLPEAEGNGLVATAPDMIMIISAVANDIAHIRVNFSPEAPRMPATTWQASQDAEFITTTGVMQLRDFIPNDDDVTPRFNIAWQGAGRYGIRVHGRSRRLSPEMAARERGESYMLAIWPIETAGIGESRRT
ncbi:hypothetical protein [Nonomuraea sp. NPDC049480]|uniref:hypothetical protein n=1 Tax=Nonomuraea sp. NPDC049480 TaxID=3364353 RepID=UPI0037B23C8A